MFVITDEACFAGLETQREASSGKEANIAIALDLNT